MTRRLPRATIAAAAAVVWLAGSAPTAAAGLGLEATCAGISGPMAMPATFSKYAWSDDSRSVADPAAASRRQRQLADIRAFVAGIGDLASRYRAGGEEGGAAARCLMMRLAEWAAADGFLGLSTEDAFLSRDVLVTDLARAYAAVEAAPVEDVDRAAVRDWFGRIARDTIAFYEFAAGPRSRANNHRYWAGVAVGTIGAVNGDAVLRRWAVDTLRMGLCQVRSDGALPLELARGRRALEYHVYALRALTELAAVVGEAGADGLGGCEGGMERLRRFVLAWAAGDAPDGAPPQETLPGASRRFVAELPGS